MPSRFVEVTSLADAARKSDTLRYLQGLNFTDVEWTALTQKLSDWSTGNATNWERLSAPKAPSGLALWMLVAAFLLLSMSKLLVRVKAQRAIRSHGHAHAE
jgi:hypothetical protein